MFRYLALISSVMFLAACSSPKASDLLLTNGTPDVPEDNFSNKITGPAVEGAWTSGCVYDSAEGEYRLRKITFTGNNVNRIDNLYYDSSCKSLSKKEESKGVYRWADVTTYGGYLVDYKFDLGNGWTSLTKEEVLLENGVLYISDFYSGWGSIDKEFPMTKVAVTSVDGY